MIFLKPIPNKMKNSPWIKRWEYDQRSLSLSASFFIPLLQESIPFAIMGSTSILESNGRKIRARAYPWGIVDVEDPKYSDLPHLREMLCK